ncbi:class B sortase [Parablautia muri]|uniref:SrtB family sortase n=1 Tax=Parablautia muri TaxID=2320879 RepID=A0A9X5BCB2_9FIRM|nr:class B sortase [Parablautia muri]NBJ91064.1 SrtB family sortase [Parablautia muri]
MKKKIRLLITISLVLTFAVSAAVIGIKQLDYRSGTEDYFDAQLVAGLATMPDKAPENAGETDYWAEILADTDLDSLRTINEEVIGWITIPGTELSYPILQTEDNKYYLNHTWNNDLSSVGSIFMECQISPNMRSFNTIIYGHKMRNGSMFGNLLNYDNLDYWQEHPSIYLVMDDGVYRYDIFAAYEVGIREIVYRININSEKRRSDFIQFCLENSEIDTGITPTFVDRVLTLSTCTGRGHSTRWVVQGILHNGEPFLRQKTP